MEDQEDHEHDHLIYFDIEDGHPVLYCIHNERYSKVEDIIDEKSLLTYYVLCRCCFEDVPYVPAEFKAKRSWVMPVYDENDNVIAEWYFYGSKRSAAKMFKSIAGNKKGIFLYFHYDKSAIVRNQMAEKRAKRYRQAICFDPYALRVLDYWNPIMEGTPVLV